jgi:phenylpropionate dioxygenase-like ring-hydroxylating dioxygenase large terminal subunit
MSLYAVEPGHNLSPRVFTSPEIFEHELQQIFPHSWIHVADRSELVAPGAYVAAMIGRTPVLVVRDRASGELRAYLNACRHRGAQLLEGKGTCDKQIKCPYHAWSYGTDGVLHGVPYRDQFAHVNFDELDLVPVRVDSVGPLVFACLDPDASSLAEWTGDLGDALVAAGTWQLGYELTYELAANWKLFIENANDAYHVQFVHDLLTDAILADETRTFTTLEAHGAHTWAQINPAYVPPGHDPELSRVRFGCVFPNFIPVLTPSDFTYIRVDPIAHDRMKLVVRSYEHPEFADFREFRKLAFERTTDQDIAVILRTQRGLHAQGLPAGVHASAFENRIGHFEQLWIEAMKADTGVADRVISEHSLVRSR